jgi:nucleotide-binding universal stress UspA family protein
MIETVLVPVDGSPPAQAAVEYTQAVFPDATVILLTVVDPVDGFSGYSGDQRGNWETRAKEEAKSLLEDTKSEFSDSERVQTSTVIGDPIEVIIATAQEENIDQVVIGSHGRDGIQRLLVGSVAEQVTRGAPIPVTITH